ncbi:MAG: dienelactone hydrolase family protein [Propionibacteriales bacterium]|nr:dienelactone hydrolase family protein [Propionibacteriales bacterium]
MTADDPLRDFARRTLTFDGVTKTVLVSGTGPAVVVLTEMPGISPHVARFARWVREAGFTVFLPSLFGRDGAHPEAAAGLEVLQRACVSAEFRAFASTDSSPVTHWLRALAARVHVECGGAGVGAIGMCFTGNFALTMMLDRAVLGAVLCQPSLPLDDPAGINMAPAELEAVADRVRREKLTVLGYRFAGDRHCKAERFAAYAAALGDRFVGTVLPDEAASPTTTPFFAEIVQTPHSVVTAHLVDEAGQPTIAARDEILAYLAERL